MNTISRYRKDANLTEAQLATLAGVSRDYIVKLEQTVYTTPSGRILEVLSDLCYTTPQEILTEYLEEWNKKSETIELITDWPVLVDEWKNAMVTADAHPHILLRHIIAKRVGLAGSQIKWAKWGSIHPAILSKYELGKTTRLPESVKAHLQRLGMKDFQLLNEKVKDWCEDD